MTLIDIFEKIIDGFQYNGDKINNLIQKTEEKVENYLDKTLNSF